MAAFDWYQATVRAPVDDLLEALGGASERVSLAHGRGHHGYAHSTVLEAADGFRATVWHGGSHEYPHAVHELECFRAMGDHEGDFALHVVAQRFHDVRLARAIEGAAPRLPGALTPERASGAILMLACRTGCASSA